MRKHNLKLVHSSPEPKGMSQEDFDRHLGHLAWFMAGFMTALATTMWMAG